MKEHSRQEKFLKGKLTNLSAFPVTQVIKEGKNRIYHFADGSSRKIKANEAKLVFERAMSVHQAREALKKIRPVAGRFQVKVGGLKQGISKNYASRKRAENAVANYYGQEAVKAAMEKPAALSTENQTLELQNENRKKLPKLAKKPKPKTISPTPFGKRKAGSSKKVSGNSKNKRTGR